MMDFVKHLERQRTFSLNTFGPGTRLNGVLDHLRKELVEVEAKPNDLSEWIDLVLLACDGAWRQGYEPKQIADALDAKLTKNEKRVWPDWRTADPNKAIQHVKPDQPIKMFPDQPLGEPVRKFEDTFSGEQVVLDAFFPKGGI